MDEQAVTLASENLAYKKKFTSRISLIKSQDVRSLALIYMDRIPDHFWSDPSSSTGKYHPNDEHGPHGLAIHSLRVDMAGSVLCDSRQHKPDVCDQVHFAALFHDSGRFGVDEKPLPHSANDHAEAAVKYIEWVLKDKIYYIPDALEMIRTHMGPWGATKPRNEMEWLLHYADNIASKLHIILPV